MARSEGRISVSIWDDPDFLALPGSQQRMYLFLISQRNLNFAGLLPLTMNRWTRKCGDATPAGVKADLQGLVRARFIVVDADAEELLVRTFVKNDDVYRQPLIMKRLVEDAQEIASPKLRRALLDELERLPMHEVSDKAPSDKAKDQRSPRQIAVDSVRAIRDAYGVTPGSPMPDPSEGVSERVTGTLPDTHPEGLAEGIRDGYREGSSRTRGRTAPVPRPPSPSIPPTAGDAETGAADPSTAQTFTAEWINTCPRRPPSNVVGQVAKHVDALLSEGFAADQIRAGIAAWQAKRLHPSALPSVVHEIASSPARASPRPPGNPYLDLLRDAADRGSNVIALPVGSEVS